MNNINELISKSNISNFKIIKLKSIPKTQNIVLLKTNQESELFIEILDLGSNKIKQILLDKEITNIKDFHPIDLENFYLNCNYIGNSDCHLKINSSGKIILQKQFDTEIYSLNYKYILKNYIFREDMVLLDLENFLEYKLYDFFSDNFDEDYNLTYLYFSEGRYEIFTLPDDNIIGFEIFNKDGDEPRCSFLIFEIRDYGNIEIKFISKIEDAGYNYVFSVNKKEIAYRSTYYTKDNNIQTRDLSLDNFQNAEVHIKDEYSKIEYFNEEKIIFKKNNMLEIFDRKSDILLNSIRIDKESSFVFKNNTLFYINDFKLNYIQI